MKRIAVFLIALFTGCNGEPPAQPTKAALIAWIADLLGDPGRVYLLRTITVNKPVLGDVDIYYIDTPDIGRIRIDGNEKIYLFSKGDILTVRLWQAARQNILDPAVLIGEIRK